MGRNIFLSVATFAALLSVAAQASSDVASAAPPPLHSGGTIGPPTAPTSCQTPVVTSSLPNREVQRLGIHTVGETVAFHVPHLTGTISIIEQAVGNTPQTILNTFDTEVFTVSNGAVPTLITEPNGKVLFDDNAVEPDNLARAHVVHTYAIATTGVVTLPNTSKALLDSNGNGYPAGEWSVQVNDYAFECLLPEYSGYCSGGTNASQYDLTVITKPIVSATGSVGVSVYLASESLSAQSAVTNPSMVRFASTLATLYGQVGIGIDHITIYDLPQWAKSRYATGVDSDDTGPCGDFGQLFTLSLPGDDIGFFMVDAIQSGGADGEVVGIDGSIPGPASLGGTVASGALVNLSDLTLGSCGPAPDFGNCGADLIAYIAAHEGGHFLGLYHTTEASGDTFDPLRDTPKCTCNACLNATDAALCVSNQWYKDADTCTQRSSSRCGGGDNLMFWLLEPPISKGLLSPEQGQVMRANPAVQ